MKSAAKSPPLLGWLTTLSDMARLRILRMLQEEELSVGELARALQLPQSTVSRHLKLLHDDAWVTKRTVGTASLYRMVVESLEPTARELWHLTRSHLGMTHTMEEDDARLAEVLAERREESASFFGRVGAEWDHLRRDLFGSHFITEAILALLSRDWVIADIGCGTGNISELIAPFVKQVIAIDREPAMLEASRKRLADLHNVEFRQGDILDLPLDDTAIDAALISLVLHHLDNPMQALEEVARTVRPGGLILIVDMVAHDRSEYQQTMGHQHLGFEEGEVHTWAQTLGLTLRVERRLRPDMQARGPGLFVATLQKNSTP